jgi:hypothetical protein
MVIAVTVKETPVVASRETPDRSVVNHDMIAMVVAATRTALACSVEIDGNVAFTM